MFDLGIGTGRDYDGQPFGDWSKVIYGTVALLRPDSASGFGMDLRTSYTFQKSPSQSRFFLGHVDPVQMELFTRTFYTELQFYSRHNPTTDTRLSWGFGAFHRFRKDQSLAPGDEIIFGSDDRILGGACDLHFLLLQRVHFSYRLEYGQSTDFFGNEGWRYEHLFSLGLMVELSRGDKESSHE